MEVLVGASAALRMIGRRRVGEVRRLDANHLRIQETPATTTLERHKFRGASAPAVFMTKELPIADMEMHVQPIGA